MSERLTTIQIHEYAERRAAEWLATWLADPELQHHSNIDHSGMVGGAAPAGLHIMLRDSYAH